MRRNAWIECSEDYSILSKIDVYLNCLSFIQECANLAQAERISTYIDEMMDIYFTLDIARSIEVNTDARIYLRNNFIEMFKENNIFFPQP